MMVDWLTLRDVVVSHDACISGGLHLKVDPESGEELNRWDEHWRCQGSFTTGVGVRSTEFDGDRFVKLSVTGSPAKFFQGHNLFGSTDVQALGAELVLAVCRARGIVLSVGEVAALNAGLFHLSRVDLTGMYRVGSQADVEACIRSLGLTGKTRHGMGALHPSGTTVVFGKGSRRWSLTVYNKLKELLRSGHELPLDLDGREALLAYAEGMIRVELRLLSLELRERGLNLASAWEDDTPQALLSEHLSRLSLPEQVIVSTELAQSLPPRLAAAYQAWVGGSDLRSVLSRATFYRYRAELLHLVGVDIALPVRPQGAQVINFRRVIEAVPAEVPEWAIGTPLYFEPRRRVG
jgi:II/X family phage/plasmid replication protein